MASIAHPIPTDPIKTADQVLADDRINTATTFTITPDQITELLDHYLNRTPEKPDIAVAIWGKVGIGKTSGVRAYARRRSYRFIAIHLHLYDPTVIKGIPVKLDDGQIRWVNTSYLPQQRLIDFKLDGTNPVDVHFNLPNAEHLEWEFETPDLEEGRLLDPRFAEMVEVEVINPKSCIRITPKSATAAEWANGANAIRIKEKAVVLLDEISTADTSVQNAALSLVLDRRAGEYELNDACRVVAAGNTEEDGAFVNPISFALANRFLHLTLRPSVPVFLQYAMENRLNPIMISFINMWGAEYLHRYRADSQKGGDYGAPTPRSWEMWCQQYDAEHPLWKRKATTFGLLGVDTGNRLLGFLSMMDEFRVNPMDILGGKEYSWPSRDRISSLMMVGLLVSRLREVFDDHKDTMHGLRPDDLIVDPAKQPPEWITALDGIYGFMNTHLEDDGRTAAHYMITDIAKIPSEVLHGAEFSKFCRVSINIIRAVNSLMK